MTLAKLGSPAYALWISGSQGRLKFLAFQSFDVERT